LTINLFWYRSGCFIGTDRAVFKVPIGLFHGTDRAVRFKNSNLFSNLTIKFDHQNFDHQILTIKNWGNLPLFGGVVVNSLYTPYEKFYKLWVSTQKS